MEEYEKALERLKSEGHSSEAIQEALGRLLDEARNQPIILGGRDE